MGALPHDLLLLVYLEPRKLKLRDAGMTRIMTTDVALELCFQLLRAVEHTRHPPAAKKA